jgi:hypothetical protein
MFVLDKSGSMSCRFDETGISQFACFENAENCGVCSNNGTQCFTDDDCSGQATCDSPTRACSCVGGASSTQTCNGAHTGWGACDCPESPPKWDALHGVVSTVITNYDSTAFMGAKLFPRWDAPDVAPNGPACQVTWGQQCANDAACTGGNEYECEDGTGSFEAPACSVGDAAPCIPNSIPAGSCSQSTGLACEINTDCPLHCSDDDSVCTTNLECTGSATCDATETCTNIQPNRCETVEAPVAANGGAAILSAIPPLGEVVLGGTPARKGLDAAYSHMENIQTGTCASGGGACGSDADCGGGDTCDIGDKAVILVMDDENGCNSGSPTHPDSDLQAALEIQGAYDGKCSVAGTNCSTDANCPVGETCDPGPNGVSTYVVGVDVETLTGDCADPQNASSLVWFACWGGTDTPFDASDPTTLDTAIDNIVQESVPCEIDVSASPPPIPSNTTLDVIDGNNQVVVYDVLPDPGNSPNNTAADCTGDGFIYDSYSGFFPPDNCGSQGDCATTLYLCGQACQDLRDGVLGGLATNADLKYFCSAG